MDGAETAFRPGALSINILPLAAHFRAALAPQAGQCEFDPAVREYLLTRDYPGNLRDLGHGLARLGVTDRALQIRRKLKSPFSNFFP